MKSEEHWQCLLRHVHSGASINAVDRWGRTPLHNAAASGGIAAIAELVKQGAALDARTGTGHRPLDLALDLARHHGHKSAVQALTAAFEAQQRSGGGGSVNSSSGVNSMQQQQRRQRGGKKRSGESGGGKGAGPRR